MADCKIFGIGFPTPRAYYVAMSAEEALSEYKKHSEPLTEEDLQEINIEEFPLDKEMRFETPNGWKKMSFKEFLGNDFTYKGPELIGWDE